MFYCLIFPAWGQCKDRLLDVPNLISDDTISLFMRGAVSSVLLLTDLLITSEHPRAVSIHRGGGGGCGNCSTNGPPPPLPPPPPPSIEILHIYARVTHISVYHDQYHISLEKQNCNMVKY